MTRWTHEAVMHGTRHVGMTKAKQKPAGGGRGHELIGFTPMLTWEEMMMVAPSIALGRHLFRVRGLLSRISVR